MEIVLDKKAMKQIRVSAQDAVDEGDTETLREDILDSFSEEQVEEIERRIDTDFYDFLGDTLEEWSGEDVDELFELLESQLADVGIDMKLQPLKQQEMEERLKTGDFDAFIFELFGRSLSWTYEFWHSQDAGHFKSGYVSADAVLERIRGARSDDEVRKGVAELARIFHDDPPAAFIAWQETMRRPRMASRGELREGLELWGTLRLSSCGGYRSRHCWEQLICSSAFRAIVDELKEEKRFETD